MAQIVSVEFHAIKLGRVRYRAYSRCGQSSVVFSLSARGYGDAPPSRSQAEVLFRDEAQRHGYSFESDQKDVEGTASRDQVIELASEWAATFYQDDSLEIADVELRIEPIRFWLESLSFLVARRSFSPSR
jgi:hypothetical protein